MWRVIAWLARNPTVVAWLPVLLLPPVLVADAAISAEGPDVSPAGVAAAFAFCLLALAVGNVIRSQRKAVERALTAREQETLRKLGEERLRIAREVHDVVAHAMVAINVQAGGAAHPPSPAPAAAR